MGRGDCVLWTGAGLGMLAGRPAWPPLLRSLLEDLPAALRPPLHSLLDQGRLWPVLSYVHRHFGDEPLASLLGRVSQGALEDDAPGAAALASVRWRACFATVYADLLHQAFALDGQNIDVIAHTDAHNLTLRGDREPFILRTPPAGRTMRADTALFELIEEIVRTRTLVFAGFEMGDPDFGQICELLQRIGRGNEHYVFMAEVSEPEAESLWESHALNVVSIDGGKSFADVATALATAERGQGRGPSLVGPSIAALDLARSLRDLDVRADLALDSALGLDPRPIQQLVEEVETSLDLVDPSTLLRLGAFMLANDRAPLARRYFQQVVSRGAGREYQNIARLNLAFVSFLEGDTQTAVAGFTDAGEADHGLALVPPRFQIVDVLGRDGARMLLACRDRETAEALDIEVATLARPVSDREQERFYDEVQRLTGIEHAAVKKVRGGFADGRLFGVLSEPAPAFVLEDLLQRDEKMAVDRAFQILGPLMDGLDVCHRRGVVHRNLTPSQILLGAEGPLLRGFGYPPIVSYHRASVRRSMAGYAAPEVLAGGEPTGAADVYALGAVLYRCVTGLLPLGSVLAAATFDASVPPDFDELLWRTLHPDPGIRPTPTELRTDFIRILSRPARTKGSPRVAPEAGNTDMSAEPVPSEADEDSGASESDDDLESWAWTLERDPENGEAWLALDRIETSARKRARWDRVADVLLLRVEAAQDASVRVYLLRELADIFTGKLSSPGSAFDTLLMLLEDLPSGEQIELLAELVPLARESNNWAALADSFTMVAARVADGGQRARLFRDLGWVCTEHLRDPERALSAYERALEIEPRVVPTLETVVNLCRDLGRHDLLVSTLISLAEVDAGPMRKERLVEVVGLLDRTPRDSQRVLEVLPSLRDAVAGDPDLEALTNELAQRVQAQ